MSIYTKEEIEVLGLLLTDTEFRKVAKSMKLWEFFSSASKSIAKNIILYDESKKLTRELIEKDFEYFGFSSLTEVGIFFSELEESIPRDFWLLVDEVKTKFYKNRSLELLLQKYDELMQSNSEISVLRTLDSLYQGLSSVLSKKSLESEEREADVQQIRKRLELYTSGLSGQRRFKTSFPTLDSKIGGFATSELSVFMGASGSGKTMLLLNLALNMWKHEGVNVVFCSLEMPIFQVLRRIDARLLSMHYDELKFSKVSLESIDVKAVEEIEKLPNMFKVLDVPPGSDMSKIEEYLLGLDRRPDVLVIDYIGLVGSRKRGLERWEVLSDSAMYMKFMAKKYDMAVITASQITSEAQKRKDSLEEGYKLYDLAGAKAIGDHSDLVISISYEENLKIMTLYVTKYRDGEKSSFSLFVDYPKCSIYEICNTKPSK